MGFIIRSYGRSRNHWSSVGYISNHIVVLIFMKIIVLLEYYIIVSIWKPVAFCYSYKKYINIAERNQHSKVELIIISFNSQDCNFIKKETLTQVFSVNFAKCLRTLFLQNTSGRLLLLNENNIDQW